MNMPNLLTHSTTNIHLGCFQIGQIQTVLLWIFSISFLEYMRVNAWVIRFAHDYSSTLAWKIPWTEEPGGLQSMRSLRVGHDWATSLSLFTFVHWRRKWQPTPVFLPGESQGRRSLVGCRLWGRRVRHDWSDLAAAAFVDTIVFFFCNSFTKLCSWQKCIKFLITLNIDQKDCQLLGFKIF